MHTATVLLVIEAALLVAFALCTDYGDTASGKNTSDGVSVARQYPLFQDVHVMIFVGFGFLVTFLKKYGFGGVAFNFLVAAIALQFAILSTGFFDQIDNGEDWHDIPLDLVSLINGDFGAAAVLISFGALFGKLTPNQLIALTILELIFYSANAHILLIQLEIVDIGGSMVIHTFGAYFGIAASTVVCLGQGISDHPRLESHYHSDMFSLIGTLFLWLFWPSFNGALAIPQTQERVFINTVLSLAGSCVAAFLASWVLRRGKFNVVDIQNATLAGGVAVGATADLVIKPFGAISIGFVAGLVSVFGYSKLQPRLERWFHDTAGVHNLHGMPGVIGGLASVIAAALATSSVYGTNLELVYPARDSRSATEQALYQLAALGVTLGVALVGGALTGLFVRTPLFNQTSWDEMFSDKMLWDGLDSAESQYPGYDYTEPHGSTKPQPSEQTEFALVGANQTAVQEREL